MFQTKTFEVQKEKVAFRPYEYIQKNFNNTKTISSSA